MTNKTLSMHTSLVGGVLIVISSIAIPIVTMVCGMGGDNAIALTIIVCGLITILTFITLAMVD